VPHTLANIERAGKLLGYTPLVPFDEGLRRTFDFFRRSL
jgi:nucleoside-diphosphate-sugar epimerase